jgi:hypothetical protein
MHGCVFCNKKINFQRNMYLTFQEDLNFDRSRKDWNFERAVEIYLQKKKVEKRKKLHTELEFSSAVLPQKSNQAKKLAEF